MLTSLPSWGDDDDDEYDNNDNTMIHSINDNEKENDDTSPLFPGKLSNLHAQYEALREKLQVKEWKERQDRLDYEMEKHLQSINLYQKRKPTTTSESNVTTVIVHDKENCTTPSTVDNDMDDDEKVLREAIQVSSPKAPPSTKKTPTNKDDSTITATLSAQVASLTQALCNLQQKEQQHTPPPSSKTPYFQWLYEQISTLQKYMENYDTMKQQSHDEVEFTNLKQAFIYLGLGESSFYTRPTEEGNDDDVIELVEVSLAKLQGATLSALTSSHRVYQKAYNELQRKSCEDIRAANEKAEEIVKNERIVFENEKELLRATLVCKHREEMDETTKSLGSYRERSKVLEEQHKSAVEKLEMQASTNQHELEYLEYRIRSSFDTEKQSLVKNYEAKIKSVTALLREKEAEVKQLKLQVQNYRSDSEKKEKEHQKILREKILEVQSVESSAEESIQALKVSHAKSLREFKGRHEASLLQIKSQTKNLSSEHALLITEMEKKHLARISELKLEHQDQLKTEIQKLKSEQQRHYEKLIESKMNQVTQELRKAHNEEMGQLKKQYAELEQNYLLKDQEIVLESSGQDLNEEWKKFSMRSESLSFDIPRAAESSLDTPKAESLPRMESLEAPRTDAPPRPTPLTESYSAQLQRYLSMSK